MLPVYECSCLYIINYLNVIFCTLRQLGSNEKFKLFVMYKFISRLPFVLIEVLKQIYPLWHIDVDGNHVVISVYDFNAKYHAVTTPPSSNMYPRG